VRARTCTWIVSEEHRDRKPAGVVSNQASICQDCIDRSVIKTSGSSGKGNPLQNNFMPASYTVLLCARPA